MAERSLVLDGNIVLRAVLGKRVREMVGCYAADVGRFAPDRVFREVEKPWRRVPPRLQCR